MRPWWSRWMVFEVRAGRLLAWCATGMALAVGLWMAGQTDDSSAVKQRRSSDPLVHSSVKPQDHSAQREAAASTSQAMPITNAPALDTGSGLSPQEVQDLRTELAKHPDGEAEVQRVLGFLSFSRQWESFNSTRRVGRDTSVLRPLAQDLDAQLAQHWSQGALTGAQALQLKVQLLEVLLPDEPSRSLALASWQSQTWPARKATAAPNTQWAQQKGVAQ